MLGWIVIALVVGFCLWFGFALAGKTQRFQYEGQTYYRKRNGTFLDAHKQPIRDAAMIGLLTAGFGAYLAGLGSSRDSSDSSSDFTSTEPGETASAPDSDAGGSDWGGGSD